ncbi:MAG: hypothetical protein COZ29_02710 [Candidatus Moranbacteria bacterium CG_4_10_14_3_um_filter_45_9]|nr:MAG: hypothetical protein COZ29_02710 [Candidatus Moranbacteria bacterium CG_4_10_14_3_um_filter_45_9]
MKIGINASFLRKPGTGIGQVTKNVLQTLISHPQYLTHIDEFVLYCEEEPELDFSLPENFHIRVFLPSWKRDDTLRKILWERRVAFLAKKDGCDAFLSLYQDSTVFPKSGSIRHTMVVHDIIPKIFPEYRDNTRQALYWRRVERGILSADHIIAISEHTKNDLVSELHIAQEKISVIPLDVNPQFRNPISSERISAVLKKYDLTPGYIYHGGGLEIRKNAGMLLRAYARMIKNPLISLETKMPILVISGKIFDTKNKLATDVVGLIQALQLQKDVKLLGFVPDEDLPALYSGSLFFVYPSLYEGFGLPVLEALCMHTPVLSSDTSSLHEVGGQAVLYTNPKDIDAMSHQMKRLISDEALRKTLISQGAVQTLQFSWEKTVQKISALITE